MFFKRKTKVLVVDDSAVVRHMVSRMLSHDPEIEVVATASDPYAARDKIVEHKPDVLTLDIEMPRMDGLTFLKILMEKHPLPVIVMSSLTQQGSHQALEALQLGAFDVLAKPNNSNSVGDVGQELIAKIKAAAHAGTRPRRTFATRQSTPKPTARPAAADVRFNPRQLVLLGASTGGTEALKDVLTALPPQMPGIVVVQHIPAYFSLAFANRLNSICALEVKEAEDGDAVGPGRVLIAPGDYHMIVNWTGSGYRVALKQGPKVWHQRPAVDVLFKSAVSCVGKHGVAGVLTGMGKDGAEGLLALRGAGARTFSQDEETSVVYGMPKAAYELGGSQSVYPLQDIAGHLQQAVHQRPVAT